MGGNVFKDIRQRTQLLSDLLCLNQVTRSELFAKKIGLNIEFVFDDQISLFKKIYYGDCVSVKFFLNASLRENLNFSKTLLSENEVESLLKSAFSINLTDFYKFYTDLMNSLPIFYENSLKKEKEQSLIEKSHLNLTDDDLCCICDERKPDIMLECCVFFLNF